jgi:iron complex transport system ATP-binding protein
MVLEVKSLDCGYGKKPVIRGVDLVVDDGEVTALMGPVGAGKSTLIKCMLGVARRFKGCVCVDGKASITMSHREWAKLIAYVPQMPERPYAVKVLNVVLLGRLPHMGLRPGKRDYEVAYEVLEKLGISHLSNSYVHELSGGQYQLVQIARALAQEPRVLLLDEPVTNLDLKHQVLVLETLRKIAREKGISILMSLHDVNLALKYSDRLVFMKDGKVVAYGLSPSTLGSSVIKEVYGVDTKVVWIDGGPRVII